MIVSHSNKFIFIKTNKTASTSVQVFLSQFLDKETDVVSEDLEYENNKIFEISGIKNKNWDLKPKKIFFGVPIIFGKKFKYFNHDTSIKELAKFYGEKKILDYYKITIVRNPYEQIISSINWHNYFRKVYKNLDEVPVENLIGNYSKKFFEKEEKKIVYKGKIFIDQIIKFENLENDVDFFLKKKKLIKRIEIKDLKIKSNIPKKIYELNEKQKKTIRKQAEFFFENFYSGKNFKETSIHD